MMLLMLTQKYTRNTASSQYYNTYNIEENTFELYYISTFQNHYINVDLESLIYAFLSQLVSDI